MVNEIDELVSLMKTQVVAFTFTKVDGTVRHAFGTLMPDAIESFVGPASGTSNKAPNPDVVVYFDVDVQAFRSFRKDRFLGILDNE